MTIRPPGAPDDDFACPSRQYKEYQMPRNKNVQKELVKIMRRTGIPPELIYAYEQTGILVLEEGYNNLSEADRAEYDAAINTYRVRDQR